MSEQYIDLDKFNQPVKFKEKEITPSAKTITPAELDILERRKVQPTAEERTRVLNALHSKIESASAKDIIQ